MITEPHYFPFVSRVTFIVKYHSTISVSYRDIIPIPLPTGSLEAFHNMHIKVDFETFVFDI